MLLNSSKTNKKQEKYLPIMEQKKYLLHSNVSNSPKWRNIPRSINPLQKKKKSSKWKKLLSNLNYVIPIQDSLKQIYIYVCVYVYIYPSKYPSVVL